MKDKNFEDFLKQYDNTDFYKQFNLSKHEIFQRDLNITFISNSNINDDDKYNLFRKAILRSELNDFETLNSNINDYIEKLNDINQEILNRFKIEPRDSFSMKLEDCYKNFLIANEELQNILKNESID